MLIQHREDRSHEMIQSIEWIRYCFRSYKSLSSRNRALNRDIKATQDILTELEIRLDKMKGRKFGAQPEYLLGAPVTKRWYYACLKALEQYNQIMSEPLAVTQGQPDVAPKWN